MSNSESNQEYECTKCGEDKIADDYVIKIKTDFYDNKYKYRVKQYKQCIQKRRTARRHKKKKDVDNGKISKPTLTKRECLGCEKTLPINKFYYEKAKNIYIKVCSDCEFLRKQNQRKI